MGQEKVKHGTDSVLYAMEQTVVYFRLKGAQVFNELDLGITCDQFFTLETLSYNEGICQRDLSKLILKDRSNTGRILNILEEKELIRRNVEMKGKRIVKMIYITDAGKKIVSDCFPKLKEAFHTVTEGISEDDLKHLRQTLSKLRDGLSKITSIQI